MQATVKPNLPEMPDRIKRLPVDPVRHVPVPWFVAWVDGKPEFRVADHHKLVLAIKCRLCWVCGDVLGVNKTFLVGPMCVVNRVSAEPPCHLECAVFSAKACPFLSKPAMDRREGGLPEGGTCAGHAILRNPGVTVLWTSKTHRPFDAGNGVLFNIGDPVAVAVYSQGRQATPEEIQASFDSGLPLLQQLADEQGPAAQAALKTAVAAALPLLGL